MRTLATWLVTSLLLGSPAVPALDPAEVVPPETGTIQGTLVDGAGRPLSDDVRLVRAKPGEEPGYLSPFSDAVDEIRTDAAGRFRFDGVPAGHWRVGVVPPPAIVMHGQHGEPLRLQAKSCEGPEAESIVSPWSGVVEVVAGSEAQLELVGFTGLFVRGRLVDVDGNAVRAFVKAVPVSGGDDFMAISDASGAFCIGPLANVQHVLTSDPLHLGPARPVKAMPGATDVRLQLTVGAELRVSVDDAGVGGTVRIRGTNPRRVGSLSRLDSSLARFPGLAPGTYDVLVSGPDGRFASATSLEIREDEVREIELELESESVLVIENGLGHLAGVRGEFGVFFTMVWERVAANGTLELSVPPNLPVELTLSTGIVPDVTRTFELEPGERRVAAFR